MLGVPAGDSWLFLFYDSLRQMLLTGRHLKMYPGFSAGVTHIPVG